VARFALVIRRRNPTLCYVHEGSKVSWNMSYSVFSRDLSDEFEYGLQQTSEYEFLNRCPRVEVEVVRSLIEEWFDRMPGEEKPRLLTSLRSHDDLEHVSAFFEIYCHELLLHNKMVVSMHAFGSDGRAKDFRADRDGTVIEMEAVLCTDPVSKRTDKAILNSVTDYIDINAFVPGFRYELDIRKRAKDIPPLKALTQQIREWTEGFRRSEVRQLLEQSGYETLPSRRFVSADWVIDVRLIPRPLDDVEGGGQKRSIGVGPLQAAEIQNERALWNTLKRKARHYHDHPYPFVIAVDTMFDFPMRDDIDVLQALIGTEVVAFNPTTRKTRMTRARDGIWIGPKGPRNTHVSAVLVANQVRSSNVSRAGIRLFLNPWAARPLRPGLIEVPTALWDSTSGDRSDLPGKTPWGIFDLKEDWPYDA